MPTKKNTNKLSQIYKNIDQRELSEQAKDALSKLRMATGNFRKQEGKEADAFMLFYNRLVSKKPTAVKTTPEYKAMVKDRQRENARKMLEAKKAKQESRQGQGSEKDAARPAKPFGWRLKGKHNYRKPTREDIRTGKAYYEARINRADTNRKKFPMLERGGFMEQGGEIKVINISDDAKLDYFIKKQTPMGKDEREKFIDDMLTLDYNGKKFYSLGYDTDWKGSAFSLEEAKENARVIVRQFGNEWDVLIKEIGGNFPDDDFTKNTYVVMTSPLFPKEMLRKMKYSLKYANGGYMEHGGDLKNKLKEYKSKVEGYFPTIEPSKEISWYLIETPKNEKTSFILEKRSIYSDVGSSFLVYDKNYKYRGSANYLTGFGDVKRLKITKSDAKFEYGGFMEHGGEVGKYFRISEMNEKLNRMFPDSFGFSVGTTSPEGNKSVNSSALIANPNDPFRGLKDADIDSKLFFPQYKQTHDIRFRIYQGGENTYFYFNLESEKGDEYIGQFGFKDRGDVPSSYITRFIAFLMEQYGLPFGVNHNVMANGGEMDDEEGVDLFEDYEDQPEEVRNILAKYEAEENDYAVLDEMLAELEEIGYTFEYDLGGEPYDLRKIGQTGKSEYYAKGGGIKYSTYDNKSMEYIEGEIAHTERSARQFQQMGDYESMEDRKEHVKKLREIYNRKRAESKMANGGEVFYKESHKMGH